MAVQSCLIVGAGLCGLTAAHELQKQGVRVTLLEKGRGVGGRMATRRVEVANEIAVFDHGAQFFTARAPQFQAAVAEWEKESLAKIWFRGQTKVLSSGEFRIEPDLYARWRSPRGMTSIPKLLAQNVEVHLNQRVVHVRHDGAWQVQTEDGSTFGADALLLTSPVPQSLELLAHSGFALPGEVRADLETVLYHPCIALMLALEGAGAVPSPGALYVEGEPISWIADNFLKRLSSVPGSITIHAAPLFSHDKWTARDGEIVRELTAAAASFLGEDFRVLAHSIHRWRYSKPVAPRQDGCVSIEPHLVFAGDAFAGAKVEGAFMSGLAAAQALLAQTDTSSDLTESTFSAP